jgi:hypothetical protein
MIFETRLEGLFRQENTMNKSKKRQNNFGNSELSLFKKFSKWLITTIPGWIAIVVIVTTILANYATIVEGQLGCESVPFLLWCEIPVKEETTTQLARRLFENQNPANLRVNILNKPIIVNLPMQMSLDSEQEGFILVLDINSKEALSQRYPDELQEYPGSMNAGQVIIPHSYDGFDILFEAPDEGILVTILTDKDLGRELSLGYDMSRENAKPALEYLHHRLTQKTENGQPVVQWSSVVTDYQVSDGMSDSPQNLNED